MNRLRDAASRASRSRLYSAALLLIAVAALLVACPNPTPSESASEQDTATTETTQPNGSDNISAPQTDGESASSGQDRLPVERDRLHGHWRTTGTPEGQPTYIYWFRPNGTFRVLNEADDSVMLQGEYELTVDRRVRLLVQDPDSGNLQREMTLTLTVRKGQSYYVFEVQPSGRTLWLQRVEPADEEDPADGNA